MPQDAIFKNKLLFRGKAKAGPKGDLVRLYLANNFAYCLKGAKSSQP
jgi:hypothetical protein